MEIKSVNSFLDYYEKLRERTLKLVRIVPPEHMNWSYKEGKFTIADMLRHVAAIERYMFAENMLGKPSRYQGCGKELADGYDNVVAFFNEMHRQTIEVVSNMKDHELEEKCVTPGGAPLAKWKWLRAMAEHEIHHRGELYIYLNLLNIKTPPMFGLTAEEVQARSTKN
ncbi:MAG: DinB family protein [Bacteroidota bacterium]